jgi:hypothetical protein
MENWSDKMHKGNHFRLFLFFLFLTFSFLFVSLLSILTSTSVLALTGDPNIDSMPKSSAMLYPLPEAVDEGKEITFDLVVYPYLDGLHPNLQKANNYEVEISFDPNVLQLKQTDNLLKNYNVKLGGSTGSINVQAFAQDTAGGVYKFEPTRLVSFTFLAVGKTDETSIKITKVYILNPLGPGGTVAELVKDYYNGKVAVLEAGLNTYIDEKFQGGNSGKYWNLTEPQKKQIFEEWAQKNADQKKFFAECTPSCEGKQCGTDGCGGFCATPDGQCLNGMQCLNYLCVCQSNCEGKICGDDGCGGLCFNKECTKEKKLLTPLSFSWNKWYTYLLIILILLIIISALLVMKRKTIKEKLHEFRERRAQKKAARQAAKLSLQTSIQTAKLAAKQAAQAANQAKAQPQSPAQISGASVTFKAQQPIQKPITTPSAPSPVPPQLVSYVKQQSAKGITRNQMEQALIRVGWKKEQIDRAFDEVGL